MKHYLSMAVVALALAACSDDYDDNDCSSESNKKQKEEQGIFQDLFLPLRKNNKNLCE